jgi:hypothetical protein
MPMYFATGVIHKSVYIAMLCKKMMFCDILKFHCTTSL